MTKSIDSKSIGSRIPTTTSRIPTMTLALLTMAFLVAGCAGSSMRGDASPREWGARIWSGTCAGCHNVRPPSQFDDEEWSVIVSHMRTRADLTRSEAEAVSAYLGARSR